MKKSEVTKEQAATIAKLEKKGFAQVDMEESCVYMGKNKGRLESVLIEVSPNGEAKEL